MLESIRHILVHGAVGLWAMLIIGSLPASSQQLIDKSRPESAELVDRLERLLAAPAGPPLNCKLDGLEPRLNFALRWHGGYRAQFPLRQLSPEAGKLRVVFRIRNRSGEQTSYFWQDFQVPAGRRQGGQTGRVSGGFLLGEGHYDVDWMMLDQRGRACRKQWRVELKIKPKDRPLAQNVKAGTAAPIELKWEGTTDEAPRPYRIAIVLHLSPVFPKSIRLTTYDQSLLTTLVTSLLENTPFRETSISAVSLEKQNVVFHSDRLDRRSFNGLLRAMDGLDLGTIGFDQYVNPAGPVDLLADVVNGLSAGEEAPDAIVFIGPNTRHVLKFPKRKLDPFPGKKPLFFYLNLDYYPRRFPWADTIERLTKSQGGKVFEIRSPEKLRKAIEKMQTMLAAARTADG